MSTNRTNQKRTPARKKPFVITPAKAEKLIYFLRDLMESTVVDEDRTIPGSDTIYKNMFDEAETYRLKGKIFTLLEFIPTKNSNK